MFIDYRLRSSDYLVQSSYYVVQSSGYRFQRESEHQILVPGSSGYRFQSIDYQSESSDYRGV